MMSSAIRLVAAGRRMQLHSSLASGNRPLAALTFTNVSQVATMRSKGAHYSAKCRQSPSFIAASNQVDKCIYGATQQNLLLSRLFSSESASDDKKEGSSPEKEGGVATEADPKEASEQHSSGPSKKEQIINVATGPKETMDFQAETRQLLDIVTHSLYTDKEVFLRELISNASDALEKLRHVQVTNRHTTINPELALEIRIDTNKDEGILTVSDTGIGLNKDEMISNLGTIARSGSKAFVQAVKDGKDIEDNAASNGIIGKFGVGFYSSFMVGDSVEVRSRSAIESESAQPPLIWTSQGSGTYDISELSKDCSQGRGTSVVIQLKDEALQYSEQKTVERILKKYSNFVNFPILVNGKRVNTIEAVWAMDPNTVTDEAHSSFYKYIANAYDEPLTHLHFRADAPLEVKALFYVPSFHSERYGMGRMEPGVSLYSRKVLIEAKCSDILPEWMRCVKGVVDSEDLPLSISREKPQDTALIKKLRKVLTRKFLSHLSTMARKEPGKYKAEFYKEYQFFLKEGICQDYEFQQPLAKLLYYETSKSMNGELFSLDEYISRCSPEQKDIYYLCAPTRELALDSPYMEAFENSGREVIFLYAAIDDFVMSNMEKYENRTLVSAEKGGLDVGKGEKDDENESDSELKPSSAVLSDDEASRFCAWFQLTLKDKVEKARITTRLESTPAVVTDHESGAVRRMMRMVDTKGVPSGFDLPKQTVEINAKHPIIVQLYGIREKEPALAKVCAEQIYDNCLVAAGILDDGRSMLPRLNDLLLCVVKAASLETNGDPLISSKTEIQSDGSSGGSSESRDKEENEAELEYGTEFIDVPTADDQPGSERSTVENRTQAKLD